MPQPPATTRQPTISVPLVLGLGALALIRPLARMTGLGEALGSTAVVALGLTALVTTVWVLVVGLSRESRPVLTLVLAGLTYAALATVLSAVASPVLDGGLEGPLARPWAIVPLLLTNTVWGAVAGILALGLQALTGRRTTLGGRPAGHTAP